MQIIPLAEVLNQIDYRDVNGKSKSFSIQFVTADLNRNTGGKRVTAEKAWACYKDSSQQSKSISNQSETDSKFVRTNPKRSIRNIMILGKNHPVSVNIRLIELFNGQEVVY